MSDIVYEIINLFRDCYKIKDLEDDIDHSIPRRKELEYCKKNYRPFKRKSVSWSSGDRIGMTFSNDEYDRTIDKFQLKKNIFLCIILKRGQVL